MSVFRLQVHLKSRPVHILPYLKGTVQSSFCQCPHVIVELSFRIKQPFIIYFHLFRWASLKLQSGKVSKQVPHRTFIGKREECNFIFLGRAPVYLCIYVCTVLWAAVIIAKATRRYTCTLMTWRPSRRGTVPTSATFCIL